VILVQITEDNNVNRHGLLRLCGAHLRWGQVCCDGNTPGILSASALCRWNLWHDCIARPMRTAKIVLPTFSLVWSDSNALAALISCLAMDLRIAMMCCNVRCPSPLGAMLSGGFDPPAHACYSKRYFDFGPIHP
jgi:hypothetical protein